MRMTILNGSLVHDGTLPKSAFDALLQAAFDDKLGKGAGGTIAGSVQFDDSTGSVASISGGHVDIMGSGGGLTLSSGAALSVGAGGSFSTEVNIASTATPSSSIHLVSKGFVENQIASAFNGRNWVAAARVMSTSNISLTAAPAMIDSISLSVGQRVLLIGQSLPKENGVYVYGAGGVLTRADDANASAELVNLTIWVSEGVLHKDTQWTCTANNLVVVDEDELLFVQSGGAGMVVAGLGISVSGNTVSIKNLLPVPMVGAVDGVNTVFTTPYELAAETIELDGVRVYRVRNYSVSVSAGATTVTFLQPPVASSVVYASGLLA